MSEKDLTKKLKKSKLDMKQDSWRKEKANGNRLLWVNLSQGGVTHVKEYIENERDFDLKQ